MSAAPARFTFDLDLARGHGASSFVNQGRLDAQLQDARMAGYGEGFAAGEQGALAASAQSLAAAATALAATAARMLADIDAARAETEQQAFGVRLRERKAVQAQDLHAGSGGGFFRLKRRHSVA